MFKKTLNPVNGIALSKPEYQILEYLCEFENESKIYANYRVRFSAELIDGEGTSVSNSQCSDYIVYTNAKIYTKMITAE